MPPVIRLSAFLLDSRQPSSIEVIMERIGLAVGLAVASVPFGMRHDFCPLDRRRREASRRKTAGFESRVRS